MAAKNVTNCGSGRKERYELRKCGGNGRYELRKWRQWALRAAEVAAKSVTSCGSGRKERYELRTCGDKERYELRTCGDKERYELRKWQQRAGRGANGDNGRVGAQMGLNQL